MADDITVLVEASRVTYEGRTLVDRVHWSLCDWEYYQSHGHIRLPYNVVLYSSGHVVQTLSTRPLGYIVNVHGVRLSEGGLWEVTRGILRKLADQYEKRMKVWGLV